MLKYQHFINIFFTHTYRTRTITTTTVVVTRLEDNRFYLHEVTAQKNLHNDAFITNLAQKPASLGDLAKVLQDIVCESDLPEIIFDENGEPRLDGCE